MDNALNPNKEARGLTTGQVLEEIKDLITEGEFSARDILIKTYYQVGRLIIENGLETHAVASYIGRSLRSVQYMVKFAQEPKILDTISKEESWHSIVVNRLTSPQEKKDHTHNPITICSSCHIRLP